MTDNPVSKRADALIQDVSQLRHKAGCDPCQYLGTKSMPKNVGLLMLYSSFQVTTMDHSDFSLLELNSPCP